MLALESGEGRRLYREKKREKSDFLDFETPETIL